MPELAPMLDACTENHDLHAQVHETLKRLSSTGALPTLPSAVTRALGAIRDPECDLEEICAIVETDMGIAARVLRLANSPMFTRGTRYSSLRDALLAIGIQALGELLMTASLSQLYAGKNAVVRALWEHAIVTAIACRILAPRFGQRPDQAFLVGLFHDLGSFAFYSTDRPGFETIAAMRVHETRSELERQWYGFDHTEASAVLAADWSFAEEAIDAIRWHHAADNATAGHQLARVVQVADALTHAIGRGGPGEQVPQPEILDACFSSEEQAALVAEIEHELREQRQLFA